MRILAYRTVRRQELWLTHVSGWVGEGDAEVLVFDYVGFPSATRR